MVCRVGKKKREQIVREMQKNGRKRISRETVHKEEGQSGKKRIGNRENRNMRKAEHQGGENTHAVGVLVAKRERGENAVKRFLQNRRQECIKNNRLPNWDFVYRWIRKTNQGKEKGCQNG